MALTVLGLLWEQPMHPYEMVVSLRERGPAAGVSVKHSSVYSTVDRLLKHRLIAVDRADRQGNRPERTVYELTELGRNELQEWLAELLAEPADDLPQFDAALAMVGLVEPSRAAELLAGRARKLDQGADGLGAVIEDLREKGLPHLAIIELHYRAVMLRAQASWVREFATEIQQETVEGLADWTDWHTTGTRPYQENP
jgi:DNA-binding PadR family transcriptional regulator